MTLIDKMKSDGTWDTLNKREKLFKSRQREKLEKTFGSIADMTRQPAAIFIVDILKEHIALAEARRLNIPTFAMVDTNSNPKLVDFPIPANDDATKSITLILDEICGAIREGLEDRKNLKANDKDGSDEQATQTQEPEVVAIETPAQATAEASAEASVEAPAEAPAEVKTKKATKPKAAAKAKGTPTKADKNKEAEVNTAEASSEEPAEESTQTPE
jgi:small subunit ribosomal protein S2